MSLVPRPFRARFGPPAGVHRVAAVLAALACFAAPAALAQPKEVVVVGQYDDAEFNDVVLSSGNALKAQLEAAGEDVHLVTMGQPGSDVPCIDGLKAHLEAAGRGSGQDSLHFLGHGFDSGLYWECPPGRRTVVDAEGARTPPEGDIQFGKARFAALVDCILKKEGKLHLDHCWSANEEDDDGDGEADPSVAQRLADETGRSVVGHTDVVEFEEGSPPGNMGDDETVERDSAGPQVGYSGSAPVSGKRGGKDVVLGRLYCWDVILPLNADACDVHVEIDAKMKTSKFKNFTITIDGEAAPGWKGSVTSTGSGDSKTQHLSWYTDDCPAKAISGVRFQVCVELHDPNAKDERPSLMDFAITTNGGKTWTADDVAKDGMTEVPTFVACQGDVDGNGTVNRGDAVAMLRGIPGPCEPSSTECSEAFYLPNADLDCDGCVDACDRDLLLAAIDEGVDPPACQPDGTPLLLARAETASARMEQACAVHAESVQEHVLAWMGGDPLGLPRAQQAAAVGSAIAAAVHGAWQATSAVILADYEVDPLLAQQADQELALQAELCAQQLQALLP